jgi:hypothetical protein
VLPSIKSFLEQWKLPKVFYLFYKFIFKPVIKARVWNDRVNSPTGDRLGPILAEAYATSLIRNHYMGWLYEYKLSNPNNNLKTEYDAVSTTSARGGRAAGSDEDDHQEPKVNLFYGNLDLAECEISVPAATTANNENEQQEEAARSNDFKLLLASGPNAEPHAHKATRDHDQEILKEISAKIDLDNQGNGSNAGSM